MKIKVYSSVEQHAKKKPRFEVDDRDENLAIRLEINDETFELNGRGGILELRLVESKCLTVQLIVKPIAANTICVDVERPGEDHVGG